MRKFTLPLIAAGAATLAIGGTAIAQSGERGGDMTRTEATAKAQERFAKMDANDDGVINEADREARQRAHFDRMDADNNGAISYDEFTAMHERRGEMREGRRGGGHKMGRRGGHRGGGKMMMRGADANNDGNITAAEFQAASLARFERADANNDGTVTPAERQAQRAELRANRQERRAARQAD